MRMAVRAVIFLLVALLVLPFIGFGVYDFVAFQSRRESFEKLLSAAAPGESAPSPTLIRLIHISTHNRTAAITARILIQDLKVPLTTHGMLGWHTTNALWRGLVALHMSDEEQVTLIASRSYMGNNRYGLSVEAKARFGRPLTELNLEEMATLVAISSAPSLYISSPERLNTRKEWLILEFRNGSKHITPLDANSTTLHLHQSVSSPG